MTNAQVIWFKKDLRIEDHRPLVEATKRGPVLALYVFEPGLIEADDFDPRHLQFLLESLEDLETELRQLGGRLTIRRGSPVEVLTALRRSVPFKRLWSHEETGNDLSYHRDLAVGDWCRHSGVEWVEFPQTGVIRRLGNRDGWAGKWADRMTQPILNRPSRVRFVPMQESGRLPCPGDFGFPNRKYTEIQQGGRTSALQVQASFLETRGVGYRREMSSPVTAVDSCSRLSPYLTFGCVSMKETYQAGRDQLKRLREAKANGETIPAGWLGSLKSYQERLRWHCHFMQKLEDEPEIEFRNFARCYDGLRETEWNEDLFQAWCAGQTGYPLVDAVMRCLAQTGWINFRMRAMTMSFSSYHLWLHWRKPALHLARVFTDYEPGIHYSQVQMQSGVTGINTIRIYSPIKQVQDQDPEGIFIRTWVPELEGVPADLIAEPHLMTPMEQTLFGCEIGRDYPAPIVDHATAYRSARDRMFAARRKPEARAEANLVQEKHGSRRKASRSWR